MENRCRHHNQNSVLQPTQCRSTVWGASWRMMPIAISSVFTGFSRYLEHLDGFQISSSSIPRSHHDPRYASLRRASGRRAGRRRQPRRRWDLTCSTRTTPPGMRPRTTSPRKSPRSRTTRAGSGKVPRLCASPWISFSACARSSRASRSTPRSVATKTPGTRRPRAHAGARTARHPVLPRHELLRSRAAGRRRDEGPRLPRHRARTRPLPVPVLEILRAARTRSAPRPRRAVRRQPDHGRAHLLLRILADADMPWPTIKLSDGTRPASTSRLHQVARRAQPGRPAGRVRGVLGQIPRVRTHFRRRPVRAGQDRLVPRHRPQIPHLPRRRPRQRQRARGGLPHAPRRTNANCPRSTATSNCAVACWASPTCTTGTSTRRS